MSDKLGLLLNNHSGFVAKWQLELGSDCPKIVVEVLSGVNNFPPLCKYRHVLLGLGMGIASSKNVSTICGGKVGAPCTLQFNPQDQVELLKESGYEGCSIWLCSMHLRVASQECNELVVRANDSGLGANSIPCPVHT